VQIVTPMAKF